VGSALVENPEERIAAAVRESARLGFRGARRALVAALLAEGLPQEIPPALLTCEEAGEQYPENTRPEVISYAITAIAVWLGRRENYLVYQEKWGTEPLWRGAFYATLDLEGLRWRAPDHPEQKSRSGLLS
jgi:hypothetical protein